MCKMMIFPGAFYHFCLIFVFTRLKVQDARIAQNEKYKLPPSRAISQEQYGLRSWFLIHLWEWWYLLAVFFHFFKILIFRVVKKHPKMIKFLSGFISQEPYIIWLSFMVHLCKMMIYRDALFIFSKFWFFGLLVG